MDDPSNDPRVGSVLQERYRIIERLAVGSMGIVYRAERLQLGRPLAVKFLHASYAADPTFIQRFERETRVMGRLAHPHCVSVIDFGVDSGPYVVMEFVSGRTLRGLLEGGRQTVERAVHIARQTLAGLAHAHSLGIIHRDIKPANIMLMEATGTGDHVRILDFGLATLREQASSDISHSAIVIGTPNYMSPEQSIGGKADVRSDVYSTGVVLFELLTGRKPFSSEDTFELLSMHRTAPVPRLASVVPDGDFPPDLQRVLDRALAKAPEDRFQSAMDFQSALDEALGPMKASWSSRAAARARTDAGKRQATRPLPDDASPDYRAALGTARSEARRASRRRRRRPGAVVIGLALLVLGGAAWGGYTVWNGELGARVRQIVERSRNEPGRAEGAGAGAPVEATAPDEASAPARAAKDEPAEVDTAAGTTATSSTAGAAPASAGAPGADDAPAGENGAAAPGGDQPGSPEPGGEPGTPDIPPEGTPGGGAASGEAASGDAATGEGAAGAADAELPAEEQVEPVAPIGEEGRTVDSAEPETPTEIKRSTEAAAASASVDSIAGAVALIRAGKREEAIAALNGLRKRAPRSAYVPYLLGHLYFEKGWWTLGMDHYEAAIANNELYRAKRVLNQNVIRALGNRKTRSRAARLFVNTIGSASLPYLRAAARSDKDADVRGWSDWLVGRVIQVSRKRNR